MSSTPIVLAALSVALISIPHAAAVDSIVVFNEVQYNPAGTKESLEFVELYNQNVVNVDMSGWSLDGGVQFTFEEETVIDGNGYLVIASDIAALKEATAMAEVLGPYQGQISNGGETLILRNRSGRVMDEITFGDRHPWPVAADGSGASMAKIDGLTISGLPGELALKLGEWRNARGFQFRGALGGCQGSRGGLR